MKYFSEGSRSIDEIDHTDASAISGGVAPIIGLVAAGIGHFTARSLVGGLAARYGLGYAVFEVARSYGGGGKRYTGNDEHR